MLLGVNAQMTLNTPLTAPRRACTRRTPAVHTTDTGVHAPHAQIYIMICLQRNVCLLCLQSTRMMKNPKMFTEIRLRYRRGGFMISRHEAAP